MRKLQYIILLVIIVLFPSADAQVKSLSHLPQTSYDLKEMTAVEVSDDFANTHLTSAALVSNQIRDYEIAHQYNLYQSKKGVWQYLDNPLNDAAFAETVELPDYQFKYLCYGSIKKGDLEYFLIEKRIAVDYKSDFSMEVYLSLISKDQPVKTVLIYQSVIEVCDQTVFALSGNDVLFVTKLGRASFLEQQAFDIKTLEPIQSQSIR